MAASFRPLRLAKYLPELGYDVWVLTATPGAYPRDRLDHDLTAEVPASVRVKRLPNPNPLMWYESRSFGRRLAPPEAVIPRRNDEESAFRNAGSMLNSRFLAALEMTYPLRSVKSLLAELAKFPDADAPWVAASIIPALYLVNRHRIDVIYTSAPPFGAHLLGLALKRITGRPWIAQYGNPWTANPCISWKHDSFRRGCERLDRAIVRHADAILVLDEILAECIADLGRASGVHVHPNGFDPEHFAPTEPPTGPFTITYAGSLYNMHDPRVIYEALALIERDSPEARAEMRIVFAGPPESDPMRAGAPPDLVFTGPLRHSALARLLGESHVLLDFLTASSGQKFTVPCKLYEYMAARRPVLAVTPEGPMADEVRRLKLGRVVSCDDPAAVARAMMAFYSEYKAGTLRIPDSPLIEEYSAPNLVREFSRIVDEVCAGGRHEGSGVFGGVR